MAQTAETFLRENIFRVFSERDAQKRRAKIAEIWADDGVFIVVPQPQARYEGHLGIKKAAAEFIAQFPAFTFTEHGEAQAYSGVGMMPWAFGPPRRNTDHHRHRRACHEGRQDRRSLRLPRSTEEPVRTDGSAH